MKSPLYVIDSFALIFRAYFAFAGRPLTAPDGRNVGAFFGFFKTLFSLIRDRKIENMVLAFDSKTPTFRHDLYPEYKANREAAPEDLIAQLPLIDQAVRALRLPIIQKDGYEADDMIASLARLCREEGRPCHIVSGDKDLMQLVEGPVTLVRIDRGGGFLDNDGAKVLEDKGVRPDQIVDYLSLVGDASDNVPGVKGIGEKTAAKLLEQFQTLDRLYAELDSLSSASQKSKLAEGRDSAYLSRSLVVLKADVPLEVHPDDFPLDWKDAEGARELFKTLGTKSLVTDLDALTGRAPGSEKASGTEKSPVKTAQAAEVQGDLFADQPDVQRRYETVTTREGFERWIAGAKAAKRMALDLETDSLDPWDARIVGFSLSWSPGQAAYIPLICPEALPWSAEEGETRLKDLLAVPGLEIVGQNFKFDWKVLAARGLNPPAAYFDTMLAAFLLDASQGTYNLEFLASKWLGVSEMVSYTDLVPKGSTFAQVPLEKAGYYGAEDADLTWRLYLVLQDQLEKTGLSGLMRDVDMPVMDILARMEFEGIALNPGELEAFSLELAQKIQGTEEEVWKLCGKQFNLSSPKQLAEVLFTDRQLPVVRKTKTGFSTDSEVLEELALQDPVPALVLKYRLYTKLKSTYVDTLPLLVNKKTGRIHTQFIPTGAATGRLSSKDPNLQNIPIKDEEGRRIRTAFIPRPGWKFVSADYSQIELVLLAHLSQDPNLSQAFKDGQDIHRRTASLIFGVKEELVEPAQRRAAKAVNFGIMYGMSAFRLAGELGIPRGQADTFIKAYFREFAGIKDFVQSCVEKAEKTGGSTTLLGRRRPIAQINSRNKTEQMAAQRVAVNSPIQGSAADLVKLAMIAVDRRLRREGLKAKLLLQVHDELLLEVPEGEIPQVQSLLKEEMEGVLTLSVPLRTSVESGANWGELH